MKLRRSFGFSFGLVALARGAFAAPVADAPIDVAPLLYVDSTDTSEAARGLATGAGRGVVLYGDAQISFFGADAQTFDAPTKAPFAGSSVFFDGNDFVFVALSEQPKKGIDYQVAPVLQRLAPDGSLKDAALVMGNLQTSGTFDTDVGFACQGAGDCALVYSLRLYGEGGESDKDIYLSPIKDGVFGAPVRVTTANFDQVHPAVTWDGENWIVAWVDLRFAGSGSSSNTKGTELYAARVTSAGALLDPIGASVATYAEVIDDANPTFDEPVPTSLSLAHSAGTGDAGTTELVWRGGKSQRMVGRRLAADLTSPDTSLVVLATPGSSFITRATLLPKATGFTLFVGKSGPGGFDKSNFQVVSVGLDGKARPTHD